MWSDPLVERGLLFERISDVREFSHDRFRREEKRSRLIFLFELGLLALGLSSAGILCIYRESFLKSSPTTVAGGTKMSPICDVYNMERCSPY